MPETFYSFILYTLIVIVLCFSLKKFTKLPYLLILPFAYIFFTFSLYSTNLIVDNPELNIFAALLIYSALLWLFKQTFDKVKKPEVNRKLILIAIVVTLVLSLSRSSFLISSVNSDTLLFPYQTDETKHIAVLTSIINAHHGLQFPYNPQYNFPYYYFYYLIPGIVSRLFTHSQIGLVWLAHIILTQLAFFSVLIYIICAFTKRKLLQLLIFLICIFGLTLKILPVFYYLPYTKEHIETWYMVIDDPVYGVPSMSGWQISHPTTISLWVPQHQFAGMGLLVIFVVLYYFPFTIWTFILLSVIFATVLGSSAFVGIGGLAVFLSYIGLQIKNRRFLYYSILSLLIFSVLVIPLVLSLKTVQTNFQFKPYLSSIAYFSPVLGVPLFYVIETGLTIPMLLFLSWKWIKEEKANWKNEIFLFLFISSFLPLLLGRLFSTVFFNDFSMRTQILYTIFSPLLLLFLLEKVKKLGNSYQYIIYITITTLILSFTAGAVEVYYRTKYIETYPTIAAQMFRLTNQLTTSSDIIISSDSYFTERIPQMANRLTLSPHIPYDMEHYIMTDKDFKQGKTYSEKLCNLYKQSQNLKKEYHFVYIDLHKAEPLKCPLIVETAKKQPAIYTSDYVTFYRF